MTNHSESLATWFKGRPKWQQEAALLLLTKDTFDDEDVVHLAKKCLEEASGHIAAVDISLPLYIFSDSGNPKILRLCSLANVKGVNALAPRKPLECGHENLLIVYGGNGSGKSGYVRMLRHASGSRSKGPLHPNVFLSDDTPSSVDIIYNINNQNIVTTWTNGAIIQDLCDMSIYDDECARLYVEGENEVSYEPPILTFFSDLILICDKINAHIENLRSKAVSRKPQIPQEYAGTKFGTWYTQISSGTSPENVAEQIEWTDECEKALSDLALRLAEKSPADRAKEMMSKKKHLDDLVLFVENCSSKLSDSNCHHIFALKQDKLLKQEVVQIAAAQLTSISLLAGIGSDVWKQMWEYARRYAEGYAYMEQSFPNVDHGARCVLCHQILTEDAQHRLASFESFVKGQAEKDLQLSTKALDDAINAIGEIPTLQTVKLQCDAGGLIYDGDTPPIWQYFLALNYRKEKLLQADISKEILALPDMSSLLKEIKHFSEQYAENANKFNEDAKSDDRTKLISQLQEFRAKKWCSEQREAILAEIERLKLIDLFDAAKQSTATTGLSRKKSDIAEDVVTEAFVSRFRHELEHLRASWLKVELTKTKTSQGRVLHGIRLANAKACKPNEVLSDGERRVVSLAAFLADVTGKPHKTPFIFDDPISSLDQEYEEAVSQRLVHLSSERQVIVFTHRISLLVLLQEYLAKEGKKSAAICLRAQPWGTGEPGSPPFYAQKPDAALNSLLNQRLSEARKVLDEHGQEKYSSLAKSICSDVRILLERIIEYDLLADVVQRFRRAVNTLGKLNKLSKIKTEDCVFIDTLMTKYSRHEHSQPSETPLTPPLPDELEDDLKTLRNWRTEFIARAV